MLLCEELHAGYGRLEVLHGVSLSVQSGEFVTLIGPNGAGKTTLLKAIVGLLPLARGSVTFEGERLTGSDAADVVARGIALVPQGRLVFQSLTVRENLRLGAYRAEKNVVDARFEYVLETFPILRERLTNLGGTLSGGQQQMLAIGRALMSQPKLMILDEPSTGLAPTIVESICLALTDLSRQGTMILLVEQNAQIALELASRAYVMEQGALVVEGPAQALQQDPRVTSAYLG